MRLSTSIAGAFLLSALCAVSSAHASLAEDAALTRCAELELRVAGLFRVGTALLYLDHCEDAERILEPVPKKFSLELARSFSGKDLSETARSTLKKNLSLDDSDELPAPLRCMADAYVDAGDGDRYDVIFKPEAGLRMYLNGDLIKSCAGDEGAEKYFMIWFGEQPFHRRMRDRLIEEAIRNSSVGSWRGSEQPAHVPV